MVAAPASVLASALALALASVLAFACTGASWLDMVLRTQAAPCNGCFGVAQARAV